MKALRYAGGIIAGMIRERRVDDLQPPPWPHSSRIKDRGRAPIPDAMKTD